MRKLKYSKMALSALFLSLGIVLPLFTSQIKEIGDTLLPMHIPVLLCGLLCGAQWGFAVGLILPFIRSLIFSMPPIFPNACWMSAELAAYGLVIGLMYRFVKFKGLSRVYISLITAMLTGRAVWAAAKSLLLLGSAKAFSWSAFIMGGFVDSALGIVLQLVLIPIIMVILKREEK